MQMQMHLNHGTLDLEWSVLYQWLMNDTKAVAAEAGASAEVVGGKQTETTS